MFFFNKNQPFYDKICTRKVYNNRKVIDKQATIKRNSHKEKNEEIHYFCTTTYNINSQLYNNRCGKTNYYFSFDH